MTDHDAFETPRVIAHRGVSGDEPGNSIEAFRASALRGIEAVEFDVRQTADSTLVVWHDAAVQGSVISESSLAELRAMTAVPTLDEVLDVFDEGVMLDVEIKEAGHERAVLERLLARRDASTFVVTSFADATVAHVKSLAPHVRAGLLLGKGTPPHFIRTRLSELFPGKRLRASRADFVVAHFKLLRFGFLRRMKSIGIPVYVWTVNTPEFLRKLMAAGKIAAVITDVPLEAVRIRDES